MSRKWDNRFIELAKHVAGWSLDPSTKVGAVIVDEFNRMVSIGFNGLPRGVLDLDSRLNDRDVKYSMIVHAEANAILTAGKDLRGCTLYSSLPTCNECAKLVIQSGIQRVVAPASENARWAEKFETSLIMYNEARVEVMLV